MKPEYYNAPLESRKDIASFIFESTSQRVYYNCIHPFCFNVKLYKLDLSFDNLLKKWIDYEGEAKYQKNDDWLDAVKARYSQIGEEVIYNWGIEDSARNYVGGRDGIPDNDGVRTLWDGTELNVRFEFQGRNNGWLSLVEFEGFKFNDRWHDIDYWKEVLEGTDEYESMDYKTLHNFYQLIVQLKHDLRKEAIRCEVENNAAFNFFANACADIPQNDYVQLKLFDGNQFID